MKTLNDCISKCIKSLKISLLESLLDINNDSLEMQQFLLFEKILGYYKKYSNGDHSTLSNHKYTSFSMNKVIDYNEFIRLINDFDLFLQESDIRSKIQKHPHEIRYEFDFGYKISITFAFNDYVFNCNVHTSQPNGLKYLNKKL